ncbi:RNA polymerase factor sigma-54 [Aureliella helgolandensis]|uniref:RNA polymerase sigma-54 factor n=2 Tax=Aureliella helgolandensis TaxID=2527968 RepID=A0A518GEL4_9BACT|nr:RNA polymerase factor sigma-54 [Aureliella helgolandensis]QDV26997.1 RNA polymerase sigma-54 factor [Aureliella helgolandensis]
MRLSFGMETRQLQTQKLSPKMIQSMEILQLPVLALQERVEQEINENPMLEVQEDEDLSGNTEEKEDPNRPTEDEKELVVKDNQSNTEDFERLDNMDSEMPQNFDDFRTSSNRTQEASDRQHDLMANAMERPESLNDYLMHQLAEMDIDSELEAIAERIISTLDARNGGYFKTSLRDLLQPGHTEEDLGKAEEALEIVQSLDPPGIAARTLSECLLNQLTPDFDYYDILTVLIKDHLEDLAENRLPLIEKKMGVSIEQIQQARQEFHHLNPKPGAAFLETHVPIVSPDVVVEMDSSGQYTVKLEDDRVPTLRISDYYRKRLADPNATAEEREFIRRKIESANWLIEAIQQRRNTVQKVAQSIVEYQKKFLDDGPEFIEPLKMQQIADVVGVHVTTISRAVDDKWIQTPRGIFPLKRFFVHGTRSEDGEDVAWETIRLKLTDLVDKEDKQKPYSDDDLVKELSKLGLTVARRTITKYRKKLGIPSSRQRKDWIKS